MKRRIRREWLKCKRPVCQPQCKWPIFTPPQNGESAVSPVPVWQQVVNNLEQAAGQHNRQVKEELHRQLRHLSRPRLKHLTAYLLNTLDYSQVQLLRPSLGKADLIASSRSELAQTTLLVRIRKHASIVPRYLVDELRGLVLQNHAQQGLLITTSTFSKVARRAALSSSLTPVTLIDGERLVNLLFAQQIGVRKETMEMNGEDKVDLWRLDKRFWKVFDVPLRPGPDEDTHQNKINAYEKSSNYQSSSHKSQDEGGGMTWRTHVLSGVSSLWLLQLIPDALNPHNAAMLTALAALGALLPDLDASQSKIKNLRLKELKPFSQVRPFEPLSHAFARGLGHRGLLHSLLGLAVTGVAALSLTLLTQWPAALSLVLGYSAHLAGDACTKSGIPWLYPNKKRCHLLPPSLRFVTGSLAEEALFPFLLTSTAMLLLYIALLIVTNGGF